MNPHAVYVFHEDELNYRFNDTHPFNQQRLLLTGDLLRLAGALEDRHMLKPRLATIDDLLLVHTPEYIEAVEQLSAPHPSDALLAKADQYGLCEEDTPFFANMHNITRQIVGGSIEAADAVMSGKTQHALHLGGGLHHAMPNKGAGFCVYNDAAIAIAHMRARYNARVLYVDTDVHHGDGVQWAFYSDPDVCTLSFHETGKYLFPGTGAAYERGEGDGYGMCVNMPLEPYTEDDSWMENFEEVMERVVRFYKPDIIVSQHGCDAHALDPLAHMHCSMRIFVEMPQIIHRLAHEHCKGRWVALGGGGYDMWRVVPRAWSLVWLAMTDHPLLQQLEQDKTILLPPQWRDNWKAESPEELPLTWLDDVQRWTPIPRREEITEKNRHHREIALMYVPE